MYTEKVTLKNVKKKLIWVERLRVMRLPIWVHVMHVLVTTVNPF